MSNSNVDTPMQKETDILFGQQADSEADTLYKQERHKYHTKIDKRFVILFCIQWPEAIALAVFMTPTTWAGSDSSTHLHVYLTVGLGALVTLFSAWLLWQRPGETIIQHVIAASGMIFTAIFIFS